MLKTCDKLAWNGCLWGMAMCYSAKIQANYREYVRRYVADMDIETFRLLYFARVVASDVKIPKAVDAALASAGDDAISAAIAAYRTHRASEFVADFFFRSGLSEPQRSSDRRRAAADRTGYDAGCRFQRRHRLEPHGSVVTDGLSLRPRSSGRRVYHCGRSRRGVNDAFRALDTAIGSVWVRARVQGGPFLLLTSNANRRFALCSADLTFGI
ncbi:hypothetical protein DP62_5861 [Burkholderia pseudomallei]|nr:hypothetical protein DP62_5861 [Burkholderia pseudomallei]